MNGIIYKITNLVNQKSYVGQTIQKPETRWKRHCYSCQSNYKMPITRAIQKYGKENFTFEIVQECKTKETLDKRELFYIKKFKSSVYEHGYNVCEILDGRVQVSTETRRKHSDDMKRINATPERVEINKKCGEVCRGIKPDRPSSSKFVGVCFDKAKRTKSWRAYIKINTQQRFHLGYFNSEIEAAQAYNLSALEHFGNNAKLNQLLTP